MDLTLAISPCPNDIFIFAGLLTGAVTHPDITFTPHFLDVQATNEAALTERFDVVKISYAAYPPLAAAYELLPCGGALGRGCGPLLLRHGAEAFDPEAEVLVPGAQTTANFLLDFFVGKPLQKRFLPFDSLYEALLTTPGAQGVVIHEKRFVYQADGLSLIQDLGEHWEAETGHPIPLGAIIARRALGQSAPLTELIQASLGWSEAHRAEALALCRAYAQDLTEGVIEAHIGLYVNAYSHHLGPEGQEAVDYFLEKLRR